MKHKFNAPPLVPSIRTLRSEEGIVPRRKLLDGKRAALHTELALRSERSTSRRNYEIPITLLVRASRKHMRVVAALTERMRTRHGSRAGWPLIHPKLPAEMAR
jgi:hypothetical protein